jgi:hypothetical protein
MQYNRFEPTKPEVKAFDVPRRGRSRGGLPQCAVSCLTHGEINQSHISPTFLMYGARSHGRRVRCLPDVHVGKGGTRRGRVIDNCSSTNQRSLMGQSLPITVRDCLA